MCHGGVIVTWLSVKLSYILIIASQSESNMIFEEYHTRLISRMRLIVIMIVNLIRLTIGLTSLSYVSYLYYYYF